MKARMAALAALTTGACAAAALTLTVGTASASTHARASRAKQVQFTLRYADAHVHFVGKDAKHPRVGDEFIDTVAIRSHGAKIGHTTSACTIVSGTSEATFVTQCAGTYTLKRGEFVTAGADGSSDSTTDAVTGGTGAYARAAGTAHTVSGTTAATVTVRWVDA